MSRTLGSISSAAAGRSTASSASAAANAITNVRARPVTNPRSLLRIMQCGVRLRLSYATAPTGGTWTITIGAQTTAGINFDAPAQFQGVGTAVRFAVQNALDALGTGWTVYVTGGPWPQVPYQLYFYNMTPGAVLPAISVSTASLTGGSGYAVEIGQPVLQQCSHVSRGYSAGTPISTTGQPTTSSGATITSAVPPWSTDGTARRYANTSAGSQGTGAFGAVAMLGRTIDMRYENVLVAVYNPNGANLQCTCSVTSNAADFSGSNSDFSVILQPGFSWYRVRTAQSSGAAWRAATINASAVTAVSVASGSYNAGSAGHYDPAGLGSIFVDSVRKFGTAGGSRSTVSIVFDDAQVNILNLAGHNVNGSIFHEYGLPFSLAAVRSWTEAGNRNSGTNTEGASVLGISGLQTLLANTDCQLLTHSDLHHRYETGVNTGSTATSSTEQAVQWAYGATLTAGTFTLTVPGAGTTAAIPFNATPRDVATALNTLLGAGAVVSASLGCQISAMTLSSQSSIRITFAVPRPIMSATSSTTGGNVIAGNAWTVAEIANAYAANADWFRSQGLQMFDDVWIAPQGSVGPAVWAAAASRGVRSVRAASPNQGQSWWPNEFWPAMRYGVPVRTLGSGSGVVDNDNDIIQTILEAAEIGASVCLMGHDIVTSSGGPTAILVPSLRRVLAFLAEHNGGLFDVMHYRDQVSYMEQLTA
jgi:hypothetical protein